jgi:Kdo2-lipid IVA lauroyltransferase/acyltransferase
MGKSGYYLLRAFTWFIQLFPLRIHYLVSDFLFILPYYIVRYRRDIVDANLARSFPEKSLQERSLIAKKFYQHFCDAFVENLYFNWVSKKKGKDCVKYLNPELLNGYLDEGRQVFAFFGHYNNWEWFCNLPFYSSHRLYAVYKKLRSQTFELFYISIRSRFGVIPLEKTETFRQLVNDHQDGIPSMSAILFDQAPRPHEIHHWITFLNQDTPVVLAAEKMAQKLDAVVLFLYSRKIKRGYYESEFQLVTDHAKMCSNFEITDKCHSLLEKQIMEQPEYWLWSHNRWKHKR